MTIDVSAFRTVDPYHEHLLARVDWWNFQIYGFLTAWQVLAAYL